MGRKENTNLFTIFIETHFSWENYSQSCRKSIPKGRISWEQIPWHHIENWPPSTTSVGFVFVLPGGSQTEMLPTPIVFMMWSLLWKSNFGVLVLPEWNRLFVLWMDDRMRVARLHTWLNIDGETKKMRISVARFQNLCSYFIFKKRPSIEKKKLPDF